MRVVILTDADSIAEFAADAICRQIQVKRHSVLGLATGSTPLGAYQRLIHRYRSRKISFRDVTTFNLDEYIGLDDGHPQSYQWFMRTNLFQQIDIDPHKTHIPDGNAADLEQECRRYDESIRQAGGIDLQLLGIGSDGHIAFNEPGSSLASRTRVKTLARTTREDNARFFEHLDQVPRVAITMGIGTILEARQILLLATGSGKAQAIRDSLEGPVTARVPASALQLHPHVTLAIDAAAAELLEFREYYETSEIERRRLETSPA